MHEHVADMDTVRAAYRLIGVPPESSPLRIKRAYRELAKTWHPDKFPPGTHHHEYAAERMRDVNEALRVIRHAPLRYQFDTISTADGLHGREQRRRRQVTDRLEYSVRVVCGALFGAVFSLTMIRHGIPLDVAFVVPVITAAAAVIFGDAFWRLALRLWWRR